MIRRQASENIQELYVELTDCLKRLTLPKRVSSLAVMGDVVPYQEEASHDHTVGQLKVCSSWMKIELPI